MLELMLDYRPKEENRCWSFVKHKVDGEKRKLSCHLRYDLFIDHPAFIRIKGKHILFELLLYES